MEFFKFSSGILQDGSKNEQTNIEYKLIMKFYWKFYGIIEHMGICSTTLLFIESSSISINKISPRAEASKIQKMKKSFRFFVQLFIKFKLDINKENLMRKEMNYRPQIAFMNKKKFLDLWTQKHENLAY